jgi:hypothetical protein
MVLHSGARPEGPGENQPMREAGMRRAWILLVFGALLVTTLASPLQVKASTASAWAIQWQKTSSTSASWGPLCSPDGQRTVTCSLLTRGVDTGALLRGGAFKTGRGQKNDYVKAYLTVDGLTEEHSWVDVESLTFSPDSKRLAYPAISMSDLKWHVVVDGKEGKGYDWIGVGSLGFSSDSARLSYWAGRGDRQYGVVDDQEYDGGDLPVFSADGCRLACVLRREHSEGTGRKKQVLVVDGVEGKEYDAISYVGAGTLVGAPEDVKRSCYGLAVEGKRFALVDRSLRPLAYWPPTAIVGSSVFRIMVYGSPFSPDGKRVAYEALRLEVASRYRYAYRSFVVLDGIEGSVYDFVHDLTFSPDSQHIAYWAQRGKKWLLVVDTSEKQEVDELPLSLTFSPDSKQLTCRASNGQSYVIPIEPVEGNGSEAVGAAESHKAETEGPAE